MNHQGYGQGAATALIVSPDPFAAALLGAAVSLAGPEPVFCRDEETPHQALARLRPAMLLVDLDDPAATDDALLGPALMRGTRVFFFGSDARVRDTRHLARFDAAVILLPRDTDALPRLFAVAAEARAPRAPTGR